ncbi:uncharacterized protein JN550_006304 [Neoarthrinium moseri]|uniref:uncharacterized protein n=1 Tax=Neoarthrinium moseri TaxID=1658444 RepID=UPI001FDC5A2D|nr:uncharacterized protein JN550_006304 [Neoarthrinium moseri]KAI1868729.1 hypothetical protein JN550_006304 [Neoarthrinium moseri]
MAILNSLITYVFIATALFYAFTFSFRVLLHPLRKFPGPFVAGLSEAYGGFYAIKKCLHLQAYKNHLKYGPVVRQGPDRLVFNSATALQAIYQNEAIAKSYVYAVAQPDQHNIFTTTDKSEHRPKRKLISQVLSDHSMRRFESTMAEQIDVFLGRLLQSDSSPINMTPACRKLGLNIAGLLGFGYDLELQTDNTHIFLTDAINFGNYRVNTCMQFTPLARLKPGPIMDLFPNSLRARLMDQSDLDIKNLKQQSLWTEAVFFFAAGGETIASSLAAAFFYLSRNSSCYEKLATEIRTTFRSGREISGGSRLSGCRYLRACIDEALRMSPPVPGILWREATPGIKDKPLVIDDHVIPSGTQVGVSIYSLHHNEEYFPDPFEFQPEKWLVGTKSSRAAAQAAFTPFSIGSRGCAGKTMAYLEISLVLAKTLWYFNFQRTSSVCKKDLGSGISRVTQGLATENEFPIYDVFAASHDGPTLEFHPRDSLCDELTRF